LIYRKCTIYNACEKYFYKILFLDGQQIVTKICKQINKAKKEVDRQVEAYNSLPPVSDLPGHAKLHFKDAYEGLYWQSTQTLPMPLSTIPHVREQVFLLVSAREEQAMLQQEMLQYIKYYMHIHDTVMSEYSACHADSPGVKAQLVSAGFLTELRLAAAHMNFETFVNNISEKPPSFFTDIVQSTNVVAQGTHELNPSDSEPESDYDSDLDFS
jgi:hypothetical protein